jgi:hypothetical protein
VPVALAFLGERGGCTILLVGDVGEGLSSASASNSPGDEGNDILSKPSASSLHQIRHINELAIGRFVAEVVETVRGQPQQQKSVGPSSATVSRVNKQHYEALIRAANAISTYSDQDIPFREA